MDNWTMGWLEPRRMHALNLTIHKWYISGGLSRALTVSKEFEHLTHEHHEPHCSIKFLWGMSFYNGIKCIVYHYDPRYLVLQGTLQAFTMVMINAESWHGGSGNLLPRNQRPVTVTITEQNMKNMPWWTAVRCVRKIVHRSWQTWQSASCDLRNTSCWRTYSTSTPRSKASLLAAMSLYIGSKRFQACFFSTLAVASWIILVYLEVDPSHPYAPTFLWDGAQVSSMRYLQRSDEGPKNHAPTVQRCPTRRPNEMITMIIRWRVSILFSIRFCTFFARRARTTWPTVVAPAILICVPDVTGRDLVHRGWKPEIPGWSWWNGILKKRNGYY